MGRPMRIVDVLSVTTQWRTFWLLKSDMLKYSETQMRQSMTEEALPKLKKPYELT